MGDRMKEANGLIGMVIYAAERSGSKYVIGMEGRKTMIVSNMFGMKYDRSVWKKTLVARIQEDGMRQWRNGFGINEREQQYVLMKSQPKNRNMQMTVWERE